MVGNAGGKNKRNYQREMEKTIKDIEGLGDEAPTLLLHTCCAPCSSYCMEYLRQHFRLTVYYYNPNITIEDEYEKRKSELERLVKIYNTEYFDKESECYEIGLLQAPWNPEDFMEMAAGYEKCPEGGERCHRCYEMRLRQTAKVAEEFGFDYFTTTLSISPLKNAEVLNEIGERLAGEIKAAYLSSDFKKKDGYKRSLELSAEFGLYRQNYCGCVFSKASSEE